MKKLTFVLNSVLLCSSLLLTTACVDVSSTTGQINLSDNDQPGDSSKPDVNNPADKGDDQIQQPETEQPDTEQPDTEQPDTEQPDTEQPNTEQPNTEQPNTEQPDTEQPDVVIVGPDGFSFAADQGQTVVISGIMDIAYGSADSFTYLRNQTRNVLCQASSFGISVETKIVKYCFTKAVAAVEPEPNPEPDIDPEAPVAEKVDHGLYFQTGTDAAWHEVADDAEQENTGVVGSLIEVKNDLVEVGRYAIAATPNVNSTLNTVANKSVAWQEKAKWSRWYQVDGHTEIFRLFKDEEKTHGDGQLQAAIESYQPSTNMLAQAGTWLEFTARYTIINAAGCGLLPDHTCSILQADGNETDKWSVTLRLDANGDIWFRPRQGEAYRVAKNMTGKGFDVRVRDNGENFELYIDDILRGKGTWSRTQEIGYRWGLFMGASKPSDDILVLVSGARVYSNTPPAGYILAANAREQVPVYGRMDIAWGAKGQFHYLMEQASDVLCANESFTKGDPIQGVVKHCYSRNSPNDAAPEGFTYLASGQQSFEIIGTMDIAFGAEGKFNYLRNLYSDDPIAFLTLKCDRATFGEPAPGVNKKCYYKSVPAVDGPSGYVYATTEKATVTVNQKSNIAYGAQGQYKYLTNQTANVICNNNAFGGDPITGVAKKCYLQEVLEIPTVVEPEPGTGEVITNGIKHPGMMTSISQLQLLKKRYSEDHALTKTLVGDMFTLINRNGRRIRNPEVENPEAGGRGLIYCGSYNKGLDGTTTVKACNWPAEDGRDAYTLALLGYITGDANYSKEAIDYLDSWTDKDNFRGFDITGSNAALQHGWVLPWFTNAAEVLRYTYSGWETQNTQDMNGFVNRMVGLVTDDKEGAPNNWLHARIEAHMAAAIWKSDKAMFDTAVSRWKEHTPSYIYIDSDNGTPVMPKSSKAFDKGTRNWDTPKFVGGMTMETCRDLNHQDLGVRAIVNTLALAKTQGLNLTIGNDNGARLRKYFEVVPRWTQSLSAHPDGVCNKPVVIQGSDATGRKLADEKVRYSQPLAHALLATSSRPLTLAKEDIDNSSRVVASGWLKKWEALYVSTF